MAERVSFGEYARRRGWSRPYVSQLVASGKIPIDEARKIDPEEADASLAKFRDPSKAGNGSNSQRRHEGTNTSAREVRGAAGGKLSPPPRGEDEAPGLTYTQVATARLGYQAQRAALAYRRELSELIEAGRVDQGVAAAYSMVREALLAIPDRLSTQMASTPEEARRAHGLLTAEIVRTLTDLADRMDAMAGQRTATQQ